MHGGEWHKIIKSRGSVAMAHSTSLYLPCTDAGRISSSVRSAHRGLQTKGVDHQLHGDH